MAEINNPYNFQSPIGAALQKLSKTITSGPDDATRMLRAEAALKLKRQNENISALGDVFNQYGTPSFNRNMAMDLAIRGGYTPSQLADLERYGAANTFGVNDPRTTNAFVGAGGAYGSTPMGFHETQAGIDRRNAADIASREAIAHDELAQRQNQFESTLVPAVDATGKIVYVQRGSAAGMGAPQQAQLDQNQDQFNTKLAETQRQFDQKPVAVVGPNGPVYSTQREAVGQTPLPKQAQTTPRMYMDPNGARHVTYDGVHDAQTGQPLVAGGSMFSVQGTPNQAGLRPQVQGNLQTADIEMQKFRSLLEHTRQLAQASPSNFGIAGTVKGFTQDAAQIGQNLAEGLGYKGLADAVDAAKVHAIANGVDPNALPGLFNFDPNLPSLHTAADLLVYQAASALAGQSGRSVSDRDIQQFRNIVGDPRDWTGNQQKFLAKLDEIDRILSANQQIVQRNLRGGAPSAAAPAAPGAASPNPPQAPGAPQVSDPLGIR